VSSCRAMHCVLSFPGEKNDYPKYPSSLLFMSELSALFRLHRQNDVSIEAGCSRTSVVFVANANLK